MWSPTNSDFAFIAAREACILKAYQDRNSLAIGFGINDKTLKPGDTITMEQAIHAFVEYVEKDVPILNKTFKDGFLLPHQWGALNSLMYNIGATVFLADHKMVEAVKAFAAAPLDRTLRGWASYYMVMAKFSNVTGVFNPSRRYREGVLFEQGDYGDLTKLKFLGPDKTNKVDPYEEIPMPVFKET